MLWADRVSGTDRPIGGFGGKPGVGFVDVDECMMGNGRDAISRSESVAT